MPIQQWRHPCACRHPRPDLAACSCCQAPGVFEGWRLEYWESVRVWEYIYRFKFGDPQRSTVDALLGILRTPCPRCLGLCIVTVAEGREWRACAVCEGTGGFWTRSEEEVDDRWKTIAKMHPGAALLDHQPIFTPVRPAWA